MKKISWSHHVIIIIGSILVAVVVYSGLVHADSYSSKSLSFSIQSPAAAKAVVMKAKMSRYIGAALLDKLPPILVSRPIATNRELSVVFTGKALFFGVSF